MIKAIFFDVDGTIYSHQTNSIPISTINALKQLKEKGIKIYIATGRHMKELNYLFKHLDIEFDGYITLNGQLCLEQGQVFYKKPIDFQDIKAYLEYIQLNPISTLFIEQDDLYVNFVNENTKKAQASISSPIEPIKENIDGLNPIYQMCPYINMEASIETLTKLLPHCNITSWHPLALDITPLGGTKIVGIQKIMDKYQLSKEDIMVFGDGHNDLEMIQFTPHSIAMGNAIKEVKEAATYVTTSIDDDGIYLALKHYQLI